MRRLTAVFLIALCLAVVPATASAAMRCVVSSPIYAADVNAGGTWYFEVSGATPNAEYRAQVTWAADPSNGGHPNAGVLTDATGYGRTTLLRWWAPDGSLPGYYAFWDPFDPISGFVATSGAFKVRVYVGHYNETPAKGSANCSGEVT